MGIASEKNRYSLVVVEKLSISGWFKLQGFQIWHQNFQKNSTLFFHALAAKDFWASSTQISKNSYFSDPNHPVQLLPPFQLSAFNPTERVLVVFVSLLTYPDIF